MVQSSSITTSVLNPAVGIVVIQLEQVSSLLPYHVYISYFTSLLARFQWNHSIVTLHVRIGQWSALGVFGNEQPFLSQGGEAHHGPGTSLLCRNWWPL